MPEYNENPREWNAADKSEYNDLFRAAEYNFSASETAETEETYVAPAEENAAEGGAPPPTAAPPGDGARKAAKGNTLARLVGAAAAVAGAAVIGTSYIGAARTEQARFTDVFVQDNFIMMEVEVEKWSENLQIRVSGDGFVDYIPIDEPPEEPWDEPQNETREERRSHPLFYEYRVESAAAPQEITLEIVGSQVLMSDVLDKRTVTVAPLDEIPPPEVNVTESGAIVAVSYLYQPTDNSAMVYMDITVSQWAEGMRLKIETEAMTEYVTVSRPRESGATMEYTYAFPADSELYETVTVTLLSSDDLVLDRKEATLTDAANIISQASISQISTVDNGILVLVSAPDLAETLYLTAEVNGDLLTSAEISPESEPLQDGSGMYEVILECPITEYTGETITVSLKNTADDLLDERSLTVAHDTQIPTIEEITIGENTIVVLVSAPDLTETLYLTAEINGDTVAEALLTPEDGETQQSSGLYSIPMEYDAADDKGETLIVRLSDGNETVISEKSIVVS